MIADLKIGAVVEFEKDGIELEGKVTEISSKVTVETRFGIFILKPEEIKKILK